VREEILNSLLSGAWEQYAEALQTGKKLELESHYGAWVAQALEEAGVGVNLEAA
jgi:hypothetical protein